MKTFKKKTFKKNGLDSLEEQIIQLLKSSKRPLSTSVICAFLDVNSVKICIVLKRLLNRKRVAVATKKQVTFWKLPSPHDNSAAKMLRQMTGFKKKEKVW